MQANRVILGSAITERDLMAEVLVVFESQPPSGRSQRLMVLLEVFAGAFLLAETQKMSSMLLSKLAKCK